jgi:8-oxo-dGTP diphosphatase
MRVDFLPEQFKVAIATSVIVFGFDGENLKLLLSKKVGTPFEGAWIIPSSVVNTDEETSFVAKNF